MTIMQMLLGAVVKEVVARGLFGGGGTFGFGNVIDYVQIATLGNATDFGDLDASYGTLAGCSSSTRGLFGNGATNAANSNVILYVTIDTTGNATDFGDLSVTRSNVSACSSETRGVWAGGFDNNTSTYYNAID